jgi:hypothetical protein
MIHTCHATGCDRAIPAQKFMCGYHWKMLPVYYRVRITLHYRPGQEKDKRPSVEYFRAAHAAILWLYAFEHGIRTGGE